VLYIKAGAASMAGAWFMHWPVRGLYGPVLRREESLRWEGFMKQVRFKLGVKH